MAHYYHVVPRNDAATHQTIGAGCSCQVVIKRYASDETAGEIDTWYYHRVISIDEAVSTDPPCLEDAA